MLPNGNPSPNLAKQFQIFFQNLAIRQQNIPFLSSFIFGILANFHTKKPTAKHPHYATLPTFHMSLTRIE
jgi:hypothetical protein